MVGRAISSVEMGCHEGDEVWEASSDEGSSICDTDSEPEEVLTPRAPSKRPSAPVRQVSFQMAASVKQVPTHACESRQGLMDLVAHLRQDNARLREALVVAQREAEDLAKERGQEQTVDFGHLLSLVKDFGTDGLGGGDLDDGLETFDPSPVSPVSTTDTLFEEEKDTQCAQVFSMCDDCEKDHSEGDTVEGAGASHLIDLETWDVDVPKPSHSDASPDEAFHLRKQLDAMKLEVETLHARLSAEEARNSKGSGSFFTTLCHEEARFVEVSTASSVAIAA